MKKILFITVATFILQEQAFETVLSENGSLENSMKKPA